MRWTAAALLRPVTFVLAIVAAVLTGNRTDSFWYGLLAFFVALGVGRAIGALVRRLPELALSRAIWPAAATGYAFLVDRADERALRVAVEPRVEVGLPGRTLVETSRALERLVVRLADEAAGHRRVAERAPRARGCGFDLRADAREVVGGGEGRVVLV